MYLMRKLIILASFFFAAGVLAQTVNPEAIGSRRSELEKELAGLESQIDQFRSLITGKQQESASLERDISILDAQIKKAQLEIKARDIAIGRLVEIIGEKSDEVDELLFKVEREKKSLAELLRRLNELDQTSLVEAPMGYGDLSEFFVELDSLDSVQESIHGSISEIRETKAETEVEIDNLETRKSEEIELKNLQVFEKKRIEEREGERKGLLKITKGKEAEYQKVLSAKQKDAATIRSQLFLLTGSPDIPFERAVELANKAFQKTGVRPAFLLAIITQETELGQNIGQCLVTNSPQKGDGVGKNTGRIFRRVMKPTRDVDPFLQITVELGLDYKLMPVSFPQSGGYGGAMGPAQFIPSTWNLYKNAIARATGHNPPDPWNPEDAFLASALLLKDNGAAEGTYAAERRAALRYFAGSNWNKSAYAFYGDEVMAIASKYQEQMNIILARR